MDVDFQLGKPLKGARIVVAMSGGVDSSVVAALAARSGAETIGVTLQLYDQGAVAGRTRTCCAGQDIFDARAVAARLGISHHVFDYESRFDRAVAAEAETELLTETVLAGPEWQEAAGVRRGCFNRAEVKRRKNEP